MDQDPENIWPLRDGTSQAARVASMLDPQTVPVDGRSIAQLTDFIQAYAKHLVFFESDDQPAGDWSGLLHGITSDQFAAFSEALDADPEQFKGPELRPHAALALTFLNLFRQIQSRVDDVSARHLDFYFKDILRLLPRVAGADQAHVVLQLSGVKPVYNLPAQTRVRSGTDGNGDDIYFRTDENLLVNTAQVSKLMYVRAEYERSPEGTATKVERLEFTPSKLLRAAYEDPVQGGADAMVRFALGDPEPGDPLPERRSFHELGPDTDQKYLDKLFLHAENFARLSSILNVDTPPDIGSPEMKQALGILEQAMRRKNGLKKDLFQTRKWRNLYASQDATARGLSASQPVSHDAQNWPMFGDVDATTPNGVAQSARIGFAVASPLLVLTEGARIITLTLGFDPSFCDIDQVGAALADPDVSQKPFNIFIISGADKTDVSGKAVLSVTKGTTEMVVQLSLSAEDPALQATSSQTGEQIDWPKLQLELRDVVKGDDGFAEKCYPIFRLLQIKTATLAVAVEGLGALTLQNDDGILDAKKPFEPFGSSPMIGSRFLVGHPDLVAKTVASIKFQFEWMGAPATFKSHYANYPAFAGGDPSFSATFQVAGRGLNANASKPMDLFEKSPATPKTVPWDGDADNPIFTGAPTDTASGDLLSWDRYLVVDLEDPDFQHTAYPIVATDLARRLAITQASTKPTEQELKKLALNPPYTPRLKSLKLSFKASTDLLSGANSLSHIHPFGQVKLPQKLPGGANADVPFLPCYHNEGEFYIGLSGVQAPQSLSLLLQLAEGSAHPNPFLDPANVQWSYLSDDQWVNFGDGEFIVDKTGGLIRSGIVQLNLPAAKASTLLPDGLYWLRARVSRNTDAVSNAVAIMTQAVTATREMPTGLGGEIALPLAANSMSGLARMQPEIASVKQPFASFGGRSPEQPSGFNTRVSERLRHKNRALTVWDYERLILDRFAQVYKAKCVPASTGAGLEIVILPDMRGKIPFNPFEPTAPLSLLLDIKDFLTPRMSPLAAEGLVVKNAYFVPVQLRFAVRLNAMASGDPNFYKQQLNDEINRFLSPWAYDDSADIIFDARIFGNDIVNFIDHRPYVDFCAELKLFTLDKDHTPHQALPDPAGYSVRANGRDEVLVAAHTHTINIIDDNADQIFAGIGYMQIGLDFKVADDPSSEI